MRQAWKLRRATNSLSESRQPLSLVAKAGREGSGSLPVFLTSFIGREDEIALGRTLLQRPDLRLLTLTGTGGIGKTRLAIAIAAECAAYFPDGVVFVSLASIQDPSIVMVTVASALGLHDFDGASIEEIVASSLGTSSVLLVVDNFEHVMDAAPSLTKLLSRCPRLKIMVTSRSLLRVEGEHTIPVPPFLLPEIKATLTDEDWLRVPVIALFIERAEAVDPSLNWNPSDIQYLIEICERLDGLPLAVELAATRMRHFTLGEINDRLNDLLPLLIGGSRDHPGRLQTMRNAIAWSHQLLSLEAQILLRQASVFSGGFSLEAIAGVSGILNIQPLETALESSGNRMIEPVLLTSIDERLSHLIDSSLLIRETGTIAGTTRYRMLETIREYAGEQLEQHGEEQRARHAHATYFTMFAGDHEVVEPIPEHVHFTDRLVVEQDNLRSALAWLHESSDRKLFVQLVAVLGRFWLAQSSYKEGRTWFERALAVQPLPVSIDSARILVLLGMTELFQEKNEVAEGHLAQGVTACREYGESHSAAQALIGLAALANARGDSDRSSQFLGESLEAASSIPDLRLAGIMSGWVSINQAVVARTMGNGESATRHIEDALGRFKAEYFLVGTMIALGDLGDLARDRGDWIQALSLYKEALVVGRTDQAKRIVIEIIEAVAIVAAHSGQLDSGATLLGAAEGLRERIGLRYRQQKSRLSLEEAIDATQGGLPTDVFLAAWDVGRNLSESQAIALVLDLRHRTARSQVFSLTGRETEILQALAKGMTDPEIAASLFISVRTVEHHVANLCRKLGVRTRTAATSTAIAAGLVAAGGSTPASLSPPRESTSDR